MPPLTPASSQSGGSNSAPMALSNILNDDTPPSSPDPTPQFSSRDSTPQIPSPDPTPPPVHSRDPTPLIPSRDPTPQISSPDPTPQISSPDPTPPTPNSPPSPRRREESREEYDPEESFALFYSWLVIRRTWSETEQLFLRLFPPGYPRRIPLDNSPNWVQRSQDGLTSKGYRMRDAGGWGMQRKPRYPPEQEKRLIYADLTRRWRNGEVTPEFIRLLQREEPRYYEFPMN